jgi:hypothetical protein
MMHRPVQAWNTPLAVLALRGPMSCFLHPAVLKVIQARLPHFIPNILLSCAIFDLRDAQTWIHPFSWFD